MSKNDLDIIKKPYSKTEYTTEQLFELVQCVEDPMYFLRNFMKIQHPLKGAIPFIPYPFQIDMIRAFHDNRFTVALTARQMGKCLVPDTIITENGSKVKIKDLLCLGFKDRMVGILEQALVRLSK